MNKINWDGYKSLSKGIKAEETCWYKKPNEVINNDLEYQNWFDTTDSVKNSFTMGIIDFHSKIFTCSITFNFS